jgi:hypothetical protein
MEDLDRKEQITLGASALLMETAATGKEKQRHRQCPIVSRRIN